MNRFVEIFKRHPWWIVGGIIGVVILIWIMTRGGGKTQTAVVNVGPSDAQVQASAAERIAQITTNAETVQAQIGLEQNKQENEAAVALAGISSEMNANNNSTALGVVNSNNSAAIQINTANVAGAKDMATIAAGVEYQRLRDSLRVALGQQQIDLATATLENQTAIIASLLQAGKKAAYLNNPVVNGVQQIGVP